MLGIAGYIMVYHQNVSEYIVLYIMLYQTHADSIRIYARHKFSINNSVEMISNGEGDCLFLAAKAKNQFLALRELLLGIARSKLIIVNIQYRFHMVSVCDITWQFIIWGLLGFDCFETEIFFWIWRVEGWTSASTQICVGMFWENILNFAILPTATMANHALSFVILSSCNSW